MVEQRKDETLGPSPAIDAVERLTKQLMRIAAIVFFVVLTIKLAFASISISFERITIDQLTSLVLALFSILLALAFYFGANDTSQKFYHQMYVFIKDTSSLLGTIQATFAERLDRLGSETGQLSRRLDRFPTDVMEIAWGLRATAAEITENENIARDKVSEIIEQSGLPTDEKERLKEEIVGSKGRAEAGRTRLKQQVDELEEAVVLRSVPENVVAFLKSTVAPDVVLRLRQAGVAGDPTDDQLKAAFREVSRGQSRALILSLREHDLATSSRELTEAGLRVLRSLLSALD